MIFPNYQDNKHSPEIDCTTSGITMATLPEIERKEFQGYPLFGSFCVQMQAVSDFNGHLLNAVVILIRGPYPATRNVGSGQLLFQDDWSEMGENVCGYFNLDLFELFNLAEQA